MSIRISIFLQVLIVLASYHLAEVVGQVTLSDNQLLVNGEPYDIRGVCWSPCGIGDDSGSKFTDWYQTDLPMIAAMQANTIRTFYPIYDTKVLDAIDANGLKVIVGFTVADTTKDLIYINQFKNHEAILMWCFGNEFNYHPEWFGGDVRNWYKKLEALVQRARGLDSNHPVTTAHGELPDDLARTMCSSVELWGINSYRWDNLFNLFEDWAQWSSLPIWISESGIDSYHMISSIPPIGYESEVEQDSANQKIWQRVMENLSSHDPQKQCIGITFFEFNDEWWKAGNPDSQDIGQLSPPGVAYDNFFNEEYWGFVKIDRTPKLVYTHFINIWQPFNTTVENSEMKFTFSPILYQNQPNPFNESTQISFVLKEPGYVVLKVYSILGEEVVTLLQGYLEMGYHEVRFNALGLATGIYFCQLQFREFFAFSKMLYVK